MLKLCLALPVFYPTFGGGPLRFLRYQRGLTERGIHARVLAGTARSKDDFHPTAPSAPTKPITPITPITPTAPCAGGVVPGSPNIVRTPDADGRETPMGSMLPIEEIEGLPVHRVRLPTATGIRRTAAYFRALITHCQNPETRPDVIQLHSFERVEALYWIWRLRRLKIPLVYAVQIARPFRHRSRIMRRLKRVMLRVFYNSFDAIVTNSEQIAGHIRQLEVKAPIAVISNGVDLTHFTPQRDRNARMRARRRLGVLGDGPILLAVGAICPRKGTHLLIEAWTRLQRQVPDAELVLVGPRHDQNNPNLTGFRSTLENLITRSEAADRVHLMGVRDDMNEIYAAADLVVLPSSREGLPNVILEAMACERPILLTPFVGQSQSIGRPGVEFEQTERTAAALADAMAKLLGDPARSRDVARAGRAWVEDCQNVEDSLDQFDAFYRSAATARPRRPGPGNDRTPTIRTVHTPPRPPASG